MATTVTNQHSGSTLITTLATPEVLVSAETIVGLYQLAIDCTPLVATEELRVEIVRKAKSGGTDRSVADITLHAGDGLIDFEPFLSFWSYSIQITQANGTKRTFDWRVGKLDPA